MLMVSVCPESGFQGRAARPAGHWLTGNTVLVVLMGLSGLPCSRDAERGGALVPSLRVAAHMQERLTKVWGAERARGVRQGTQDVLMGLTMPGVLVEVGFLDHPIEGAELLLHDVRAHLADALAAAILDVRDEHEQRSSAARR